MAKPRKLRGFVFAGKPPPPHRGRSPDWPKFKKLMCGSQGSRRGISTSAHANAAASATLANAPIRLNPSTSKASTIPLGSQRAGQSSAGVIVDMQFPCHSTPRPWWGPIPEPAVRSNARNPRWFHGGGNLSIQVGVCSLCGEEGAVETASLLRRVHYAKFWRPAGSTISPQLATAEHAPGQAHVESLRSCPS